MGFPPIDKSFEGLMKDTLIRLTLVERRLAIQGGGGGGGDVSPVLAGTIVPYAGSAAPTGWLICDGAAYSRSQYADLFGAIGTAFGGGDGSTTFNVPNLKGRIPVGRDAAQTEFDVLGETGGEKAHTLTVAEMPLHKHTGFTVDGTTLTWGAWGNTAGGNKSVPGLSGSPNVFATRDEGGGGAHNNLQPYQVTNYIISIGAGGGAGGGAGIVTAGFGIAVSGSGTLAVPYIVSANVASEILSGVAEIATQAEVTTGTDHTRIVTPLTLKTALGALPAGDWNTITNKPSTFPPPQATETLVGGAEIATTAEASTGTDHTRIITPLTLKAGLDTKAALVHTHTSSQITDFATAVPAAVPAASETVQGKAEIATQAEVTTGTDDLRIVTPLKLAQRIAAIVIPSAPVQATETVAGIAEIATQAETTTGTDDLRIVTPLKLAQRIAAIPATPAATETVAGIAEIATTTETNAGTDDQRIVTPLKLKGVADTKAPLVHTHTSSQITDFATAVPAAVPQATETVAGKAEVATQAETTTGTDDARMITPLKLAQRIAAIVIPSAPVQATETVAGIAEIATQAETTAGTDDLRIVTPLKLAQRIALIPAPVLPVASETVQGIVELATAAETTTGTDNTRAVHPQGLKVELDKKAPLVHTHTASQITDFATAVPAAVPQATESVAGKAEIATQAETTTGTDDLRIVTPLKLAQRIAAIVIPPAPSAATETVAGIAEIATQTETTTGTDDARIVTPLKLAQRIALIPPTDWSAITGKPATFAPPQATETLVGGAEIATTTEASTGTDHTRIITPLTLKAGLDTKAALSHTHTSSQITDFATAVPAAVPAASETVQGKVELATATETTTGTDNTRAVHPLGLKSATNLLIPKSIVDAKGDLIVASGNDSPVRFPIGADAQILVADSTTGFGMKWAAPSSSSVPAATETVAGIAEIATAAEATTGTDHTRIITPLTLKQIGDTKAPISHTHTSSQITDFATAVPAAVPAASETVAGKAEIATQAETTAGTDDARIVSPLKLAQRLALGGFAPVQATETLVGGAEIATTAEASTGTDHTRIITPLTLKNGLNTKANTTHSHSSSDIIDIATAVPLLVPAASETVQGKAEIATQVETDAGTDDTRFVTPLKFAVRLAKVNPSIGFLADAPTSVPLGTWVYTTIALGSAPDWNDDSSLWSYNSATSTITILKTGLYQMSLAGRFQTNGTGSRQILVASTGTSVDTYCRHIVPALSGIEMSMGGSETWKLQPGQDLIVQAAHTLTSSALEFRGTKFVITQLRAG